MMKLDRPLCVFDLEATGTDVAQDRIVDVCVIRREPDGSALVRGDHFHRLCRCGHEWIEQCSERPVRDARPSRRR